MCVSHAPSGTRWAIFDTHVTVCYILRLSPNLSQVEIETRESRMIKNGFCRIKIEQLLFTNIGLKA